MVATQAPWPQAITIDMSGAKPPTGAAVKTTVAV